MSCLTLGSVCIIRLRSYMKCVFWPNSLEIFLALGNESSQNRRAHEHLNPPECEIIMASWCHFSGESSEQMAKIWELNLVYTTPLRTSKKLVWFGLVLRGFQNKGVSQKSLPLRTATFFCTHRIFGLWVGSRFSNKRWFTTAETFWTN